MVVAALAPPVCILRQEGEAFRGTNYLRLSSNRCGPIGERGERVGRAALPLRSGTELPQDVVDGHGPALGPLAQVQILIR